MSSLVRSCRKGPGLRFDDRLKTVLDTPVADERDRAVRWRQLVDLLSRARGRRRSRADRPRDPGGARRPRPRPRRDPRRHRALDRRAPARPASGRRCSRPTSSKSRRRSWPGPPSMPPPAPKSRPAPATRCGAFSSRSKARRACPTCSSLKPRPKTRPIRSRRSAKWWRGSRRCGKRGQRRGAPPRASTPPDSAVPDMRLFRWESDALGAIAWVEGAPRGALIGRTLAGHAGEALLGEQCRDLVARRAPFADVPLASGEPFGGTWKVSGAPAFAPGDGRFIGYRGIARRDRPVADPARRRAARVRSDADSLREMVHEIKTPLNAIIGFAEIIDGQYLGPAHRRYRQRAADIVGAGARACWPRSTTSTSPPSCSRARQCAGRGHRFRNCSPRRSPTSSMAMAPARGRDRLSTGRTLLAAARWRPNWPSGWCGASSRR